MSESKHPSASDLSPVKRALMEKLLRGDGISLVPKHGIPRRAGTGPAPLSFAQRRLWFANQLAPDSPLYHISLVLRFQGPLNTEALEQSLRAVLARHESLRSRFVCVDGEPAQVADASSSIDLRVMDWTEQSKPAATLPGSDVEQDSAAALPPEVRQLFNSEIGRPFDLSADVLLRALLVKLDPIDHVLLLVMHHIVSDGWSMEILAHELLAFYGAFVSGTNPSLAGLPVQYPDYAVWQRETMQGQMRQELIEWWKQRLAGAPDLLELPMARSRPAVQSFRGRCRWKAFPRSLSHKLNQLSAREGSTLYQTLLAAFQVMLHRLTGRTDIVVGTPTASRAQTEAEGLIGLFVNMLALRSTLAGDPSFQVFLRHTRDNTLEAFAHQELPFESLVEALRPDRTPSHSPLIQVVFALQNAPGPLPAPPGLTVTPIPERQMDTCTAKFDLTFQLEDSAQGLSATVEYNTELFDEAAIDRWLSHYQVLLEAIVKNPLETLKQLPLLTPAERHQILVEWNETRTIYPRDKSIPELFAVQANRNPNAVAVTLDGQQLTYRRLDHRANQIASLLRTSGVGPDVLVAVCLERSIELIVVLLGILKAGGAYVCLDPACPRERLAFMLEDSQAPVLFTQQKLRSIFEAEESPGPLKVICLDSDSAGIASQCTAPAAHDRRPPGPMDLAYVSYTSGSTGRPKGVSIPHRAVVRLLFNTDYLQLNSSDVVAQISNSAFDASTFEIWGALLHGGRLAILPPEVALSGRALAQAIRDQRITTMFVTTALFNQLSREVPEIFHLVRHLLFGGEAANPNCVRDVLKHGPPARLLHMYGPTETTTFAAWHEVRALAEDASSVPIGRAIANTELYVLDELRQPVPIGVTGELHIGGDGLARGYFNHKELTDEKFVPHPFLAGTGARLYRTGDWVRYLPDGNLEFIGRADAQVKLRGFRVELGEIEAALSQHPNVRECAAIVHGDADDKRLAACVVARESQPPAADELRSFLRARLPDYMVPSAFVFLPSLPLNANGKVDRAALPALSPIRPEPKESAVPCNEIELRLKEIWEDLLGVRPVGVLDNFFELGGHSLLAMRLLARIEKAFGQPLPISAIFQSPTLRQLAGTIRGEKSQAACPASSLVKIQPNGTRPPLFLVHGAGGGMFWGYTNLSCHLGLDQPVYGFKSSEPNGPKLYSTIEEMAAQYVADLREFQPRGPYHLGGYCFGGNVAWEMARQLHAQGERVALLALLNSAPTHSRQARIMPTPAWILKFLRNLGYLASCFLSRPFPKQRRFLAWQARTMARRLKHTVTRSPAPVEVYADELVELSGCPSEQRPLWEAHIRALITHRTQPYAGPVTLLRSRAHPFWSSFDPAYDWGEFVKQAVDVRIVPGTHEQILEEPHVRMLAQELGLALRKAQGDDGASLARSGSDETEKNEMAAGYPCGKCVHELFEEQVGRTAGVVAVSCKGESLTYRDLNERADYFAHHLMQRGVGPDVPVGICLDRSLAMAVSVLAVLKAGGAYVPLDPAYPRERLQLMLKNTRSPLVITQRSLATDLGTDTAGFELISVEDLLHAPRPTHHVKTHPNRVNPDHLAYVIHTSGSTGTPKGVAMPHRPLVNLIDWQLRNSKVGREGRTLQFASLSFDVSFQEMFSTWCAGGTLVLVDEETRRDPAALLRFITDQRVERLFLPFVALHHLAEACGARSMTPTSLREVITAGEQLQITPGLVRMFEQLPGCTLHNHYGPSETHVVTAFTLNGSPRDWPALPPIGQPIANTQIHLLDADRQPVPVDTEGEIYIGGDCLARGYLHRPELTDERFVPNPFQGRGSSARLYKTGDLARRSVDGNIEFLGRVDHQVKIRGFRVELGEIEAALRQHPKLREAVVTAREDRPGDKRLVAYFVPKAGEHTTAEELRHFLQEKLPDYMTPSVFMPLKALPVTPNGKVDRKQLPAPTQVRSESSEHFEAPRDEVERQLTAIWEEVLNLRPIGIRDEFFEVGGHSLLASQLVADIEKQFETKLSVAALLQSPTVEQLAKRLREGDDQSPSPPTSSIVAIQSKGSKPPLFLVHGAGGGMFWGYANLSHHLGPDQPVYAFHSRGLDGLEEFGTIEEMAARYVADLRAIQPRGPYRLGGYCFGGNVAYEMARQLEAQGEKVASLAVFNAWPPNSSYTSPRLTPKFCLRFLNNLRYWAGYVLGLKPEQQRELLLWKLRSLSRKSLRLANRLRTPTESLDVAEWVDLSDQPQERHALWAAHIRAWLECRPKPFGGHLTLFRTRCHPLFCSFDDACGWRELAAGGVTVHVVPGAHESVLDEPHVATLAGKLEHAIQLTRKTGQGSAQAAEEASPSTTAPLHALVTEAPPAQQPEQTPGLPLQTRASRPRNRAALFFFVLLLIVLLPAVLRTRIRHTLRSKVLAGSMQSQSRLHRGEGSQSPQPHRTNGPLTLVEETGPPAGSIIQWVEAQAARTPDLPAVVGEGESLTYRELDERANRLASQLHSRGVGPEVLVGVCMERSPQTMVALLAILKAGGAYVPMDPAYPRERLQFMMENARVPVMLTQERLRSRCRLPEANCELLCVDTLDLSRDGPEPGQSLGAGHPQSHHLAYVIYTSGSTGRPKGVLIPHSALVNHCLAICKVYQLVPGDRVLQFAPLNFDVAAEELFPAWISGATVILRPDDCTDSMDRFLRFVERERLTALNLPASWWHELVDHIERSSALLPPSVRLVVTGNERVLPGDLARWRRLTRGRVRWLNAYGPTEATITATLYEPDFSMAPPETSSVPIGRPIANVQAMVLDEGLCRVPDGEPGELHLGGAGVARGYLNQPQLTAARFIQNPFNNEPVDRLYKTGDRARVLPDGNLEFIGRFDEQVKIRGFRIEPGEVELALASHPAVKQVVVVAREDRPGQSDLVAYFVPAPGQSPNSAELRVFLCDKLPDYMVPSSFVRLGEMPLTPNGKVDRKGLPAPESTEIEREFVAPRDEVERRLAVIWEEVLNTQPIGLQHHFFEAGGNSLLAARIVALVEQQFSRKLSVAAIFRAPTVEQLARLLRNGESQNSSHAGFSIVEIQPHGSAPPLFLVHGIGGGMFWGYANLARHLGTDQPVFAFKSRGLEGLEEFNTIERMAMQYVADLRAFRPRGPYRLGGYCFGGNVAYEMARQLEAQGEQVALLALFNSPAQNSAYGRIRITPAFCFRFVKNLAYWTAHVLELASDQRRQLLQWKARAIAKKCLRLLHLRRPAPSNLDVEEWMDLSGQPEERHQLWAAHLRAYLDHRPKPYAGCVTLFRTRGHPVLCSFDDACGWRELVTGGVEVHVVPGAHESILDEPHVRTAAEALKGCLRNLSAASRIPS